MVAVWCDCGQAGRQAEQKNFFWVLTMLLKKSIFVFYKCLVFNAGFDKGCTKSLPVVSFHHV